MEIRLVLCLEIILFKMEIFEVADKKNFVVQSRERVDEKLPRDKLYLAN